MESGFISGTVVIGIGNEFRSDDAVGLMTVRKLRSEAPEGLGLIEHNGEGASLLETWKNCDLVFVVDAVSSGARSGSIHRFFANTERIPEDLFSSSSHAFGLAQAIEMSRVLGQLPQCLIVYGIEGKAFEAGQNLSPDVEAASVEVIKRILDDINLIKSEEEIT